MDGPARSASEVLADVVARLRPADVPDSVVATIDRHLLDTLGVALAASTLPFAPMALRAAAALGGAGDGSVIGFSDRLPPVWAALVNGTLAHGIDFDDTHAEGVIHVSCSVIPAALAAAEAGGATGAQFVTALALGMETAVRLGSAAPGRFHDRGFHPTGVCGAFAATVAAGAAAALDGTALRHALGLAGSMASGLLEFLTDGTWAKRLHAGWAAHAGLTAARLGAEGFTGPREVLDGRFGFYRSHLGDDGWDLASAFADLGARWRLTEIALKPYPACHMTHAFIDCAARLRAEVADADAVAAIECFIHPREMPIVCEPRAAKLVPQTEYDAQFSLPYTVASMLVRGHVALDDFTAEAIRDPHVLALAARVTCVADPDADYPRTFPGRMRVRLRDEVVREYIEPVNRGSAERPLTAAEVVAKFRRNAARALPDAQCAALEAAVQGIAAAPSVRALAAACRPAE
jgi:2-methylcitrate dehydratase PrpD